MSDKQLKTLPCAVKPYPYNAQQLAWLHDLDTTTESQAQRALHSKEGFCCLGRACVVIGLEASIPRNDNCLIAYDGEYKLAPPAVVTALRLRGRGGTLVKLVTVDGTNCRSLADLNDSGWSFKRIAAYIRANPWNVFKGPNED
jgi:hypothetical protein